MGGKHPAPGLVYIVCQHNSYAVGKNDEHMIVSSKIKEAKGDTGWRITNIPNDENIERLGYNFISHNNHKSKLLGCDQNGRITVSEVRKWNSLSGWKIIQKKDTNVYQFVSYNGYWLSIKDNGELLMLKKEEFTESDSGKASFYLEYITKEEVITQKTESTQNSMQLSNVSIKRPVIELECDNGYTVDTENDDRKCEETYTKFKAEKKQNYEKKMMHLLTQLSNSIEVIRSDIATMKVEMKTMKEKQQIERNIIHGKLDMLQDTINATYKKRKDRQFSEQSKVSKRYLNEDRKKLKDWLTNTVGFGGYYHLFIKNGFDSLTIVQKINDIQQLNDIGIVLKGHQLQVMAEILQLQQENVYDQCNYI